MNNKKLITKVTIGTTIAAVIFLIFGLIFIGVAKLNVPTFDFETGKIVATKISGFSALDIYGLDTVLSNGTFREWIVLPGSQLSLLTCGIVFAVIFTPILFIISGGLFGYYYLKFMNKTTNVVEKETLVEENINE